MTKILQRLRLSVQAGTSLLAYWPTLALTGNRAYSRMWSRRDRPTTNSIGGSTETLKFVGSIRITSLCPKCNECTHNSVRIHGLSSSASVTIVCGRCLTAAEMLLSLTPTENARPLEL